MDNFFYSNSHFKTEMDKEGILERCFDGVDIKTSLQTPPPGTMMRIADFLNLPRGNPNTFITNGEYWGGLSFGLVNFRSR